MASSHDPGRARPESPLVRLTVTSRPSVRRAVRLTAATVLVAAAGAALPLSPAAAETCSSDTGVSVVVDATGLGGAISTSCVADGGGDSAASLFEVHHDLTRAARFPGAVCRVDGAPADAECQNMPPADAYWGLFWSGGSGGWVYSSEGVDSLEIPDGGSVAFAWQDGGDQDAPGVAPPQTAEEEPSSSPSPQPTAQPGGGSGGSGGGTGSTGGTGGSTAAPSSSPTASATGSATPGAGETGGGKPRPDRTTGGKGQGKDNDGKRGGERRDRDDDPVADPSESSSPTTEDATAAEPPAAADEDGLPAWVAPAGIAGLFGVAGVVALLRRRAMS